MDPDMLEQLMALIGGGNGVQSRRPMPSMDAAMIDSRTQTQLPMAPSEPSRAEMMQQALAEQSENGSDLLPNERVRNGFQTMERQRLGAEPNTSTIPLSEEEMMSYMGDQIGSPLNNRDAQTKDKHGAPARMRNPDEMSDEEHFPPTVEEFIKLHGRTPATDSEVEYYYGEGEEDEDNPEFDPKEHRNTLEGVNRVLR